MPTLSISIDLMKTLGMCESVSEVDWIIKIKPLISQILFFICFYDIYIATSGLQRYYPLRKYIHCKILHILNINIK